MLAVLTPVDSDLSQSEFTAPVAHRGLESYASTDLIKKIKTTLTAPVDSL